MIFNLSYHDVMCIKFHYDSTLPSWKTNFNLQINLGRTDERTHRLKHYMPLSPYFRSGAGGIKS